MTCREALDRMLEADPAALGREPGADPALEEHLAGCGRCRGVAATLAAELDALDAGLEDLVTTGSRAAASAGIPPAVADTRSIRRRGPRAWAPLAAAAALATVLAIARSGGGPDSDAPDPAMESPTRPGAGELARVAVTLPTDRGAAVVSTTNPKITVVWLYERSER